jgi:hypothetical protein
MLVLDNFRVDVHLGAAIIVSLLKGASTGAPGSATAATRKKNTVSGMLKCIPSIHVKECSQTRQNNSSRSVNSRKTHLRMGADHVR